MAPMKRLLLLSLLLVFAVPARAHAAEPCRNKIFNDWYSDGKVASTYSHACYVDALKHIPPDARVYSNLSDDIKAAMRAAERRSEGKSVPTQIGHGFASLTSGGVAGANVTNPGRSDSHDRGGATPQAAGPVADTSSGSGVPVPILILGAVALLLVAAGAAGGGLKYVRSRRQ
jgi:hypothetical protein